MAFVWSAGAAETRRPSPCSDGAGGQAADGQTGPAHGPKRTGTAMGASWLRGSPVIDARAAWEPASDGSEGAISGSWGSIMAMPAATAAAKAQAARRRGVATATGPAQSRNAPGRGVDRHDPDGVSGAGDLVELEPAVGTGGQVGIGLPPGGRGQLVVEIGREGVVKVPTGAGRPGNHCRAVRRRRRPRWMRDRTVPTGTAIASAISS